MSAALFEYDAESVPLSGKYRKAPRPRVDTFSYVEMGMSRRLAPAVLPLFTFAVDGEVKRLRRPLLLRVAVEEGEYFVENDALRIFGHGVTLAAAVSSFSRDIAYFWQYYRDLSDDDVAGEGTVLKQRYEELVT